MPLRSSSAAAAANVTKPSQKKATPKKKGKFVAVEVRWIGPDPHVEDTTLACCPHTDASTWHVFYTGRGEHIVACLECNRATRPIYIPYHLPVDDAWVRIGKSSAYVTPEGNFRAEKRIYTESLSAKESGKGTRNISRKRTERAPLARDSTHRRSKPVPRERTPRHRSRPRTKSKSKSITYSISNTTSVEEAPDANAHTPAPILKTDAEIFNESQRPLPSWDPMRRYPLTQRTRSSPAPETKLLGNDGREARRTQEGAMMEIGMMQDRMERRKAIAALVAARMPSPSATEPATRRKTVRSARRSSATAAKTKT